MHTLAAPCPARTARPAPPYLGLRGRQGLAQRRVQQGGRGGHNLDALAADLVQQLAHRGQLLDIEAGQHQRLF